MRIEDDAAGVADAHAIFGRRLELGQGLTIDGQVVDELPGAYPDAFRIEDGRFGGVGSSEKIDLRGAVDADGIGPVGVDIEVECAVGAGGRIAVLDNDLQFDVCLVRPDIDRSWSIWESRAAGARR